MHLLICFVLGFITCLLLLLTFLVLHIRYLLVKLVKFHED